MKNDVFISPLEDFAFKQIFGEQQNIGNTKAFLKTLLGACDDDLNRLTVVNPSLGRMLKKDKSGVVDIKMTTKSGKIVHIELQVEKRANLKSRVLYYAARQLGDQLKCGEDYNKLHQVISVVICNHRLIDEEDSYINDYELRNGKNKSFTNLLKVIILELPKLPEIDDGALWPWLRFLKCKKKEEFEMLRKKHPELKKAVSCVKRASFTERWRYTMLLWKMQKLDENEMKREWKEKGLEEGRVEGEAEREKLINVMADKDAEIVRLHRLVENLKIELNR